MGAIFFLCLYALLYDVKRIHKMQNEKELKKKYIQIQVRMVLEHSFMDPPCSL